MFQLIVLIHLLAAGIVTIYLGFFWQRVDLSVEYNESSRICKLLSGCISGGNTNLTLDELERSCKSYVITRCTGEVRCCTDCKKLSSAALSYSTQLIQQPPWIVISFEDMHKPTIIAIGTGMFIFLLLYVVLIAMRYLYKSRMTHREGMSHTPPSPLLCYQIRVLTGAVLVLSLFLLLTLSAFCISHTVRSWKMLIDCQTTAIVLVSWVMVVVLALFDYTVLFMPRTVHVLLKKKKIHSRKCFSEMLHRFCSKITNVAGGVMILWWIFIGIYLQGVRNGQWKIVL